MGLSKSTVSHDIDTNSHEIMLENYTDMGLITILGESELPLEQT